MNRKSLLPLLVLILGLSGQQALAQSTMMNAPSSDVVAAKKVYLEMDFITNYAWAQGDDRFANYLPRAVVGVGKNIEVGVNVSYTHTPVGGEPIEIQPNAKWQFYNNEGKGVAAAAGCMFFVPITNRAGTDTFRPVLFSRQQTVFRKLRSEVYRRWLPSDWRRARRGNKTGVIAGYEQPLTQRLSFIVDWAEWQQPIWLHQSVVECQHAAQRQSFGRLRDCQPGTRPKLAVLLLRPAILVAWVRTRPACSTPEACVPSTSCCNSDGSLKSIDLSSRTATTRTSTLPAILPL